MADIRLADISEFQANIEAGAYLAAGHTCLIVRAHNGHRADHMWPVRRDYLRRYPFDAIGFYQYLVSSRPAPDQAHDFIATVGDIRANEFVVCDSEEGAGGQIDRVQSWFDVVDQRYGKPSTLYASESWFAERLGGVARWKRPRWVAAYRSTEPTVAHELWQCNDHSGLPGITGDGGDGNLFHGTGKDFARVFAAATGSVPAPAPAPTPAPSSPADSALDAQTIVVGMLPNGGHEVFVELPSGEIVHRWQAADGSWAPANWPTLGTPGR